MSYQQVAFSLTNAEDSLEVTLTSAKTLHRLLGDYYFEARLLVPASLGLQDVTKEGCNRLCYEIDHPQSRLEIIDLQQGHFRIHFRIVSSLSIDPHFRASSAVVKIVGDGLNFYSIDQAQMGLFRAPLGTTACLIL